MVLGVSTRAFAIPMPPRLAFASTAFSMPSRGAAPSWATRGASLVRFHSSFNVLLIACHPALMYHIGEISITSARGEEHILNNVAAGAAAGLLFKSTGTPTFSLPRTCLTRILQPASRRPVWREPSARASWRSPPPPPTTTRTTLLRICELCRVARRTRRV